MHTLLEHNERILIECDYENMGVMLAYLLDAYKSNRVTKEKFVATVLHITRQIELGQYTAVRDWFAIGRRLIR